MATPGIKVEVGFGDGPLVSSPTWTEIDSGLVLSFTTTEGRTSETDQTTQPSQAVVTFDNSGRTFDPEWSSGPYHGDLLPGKQVRVTVDPSEMRRLLGDLGATSWYDAKDLDAGLLDPQVVFRGIVNVDGWQQTEYRHPAVSTCRIVCNDLLGHLARQPARYGLYEAILDRFATRDSAGVLHWPLSDTGDLWDMSQTFYDPRTGSSGYGSDRDDLADIHTAGGVSTTTYATAAEVRTDATLRPSGAGALDVFLGRANVNLGITGGWTNSDASLYGVHTFGFGIRLRSFPASATAFIAETFLADGRGYYLDRFGRIYATMDGGTTVIGGTFLELGRAYHICDVWDGPSATWRLYIDGVEVDDVTSHPIDNSTLTQNLYVGGSANPVHAEIGDVFGVKSVLSAADVEALAATWSEAAGVRTVEQANLLLESVGAPAGVTGTGRVSVAAVPGGSTLISPMLQALERTELGRLHYRHAAEQVAFVTQDDLATGTRYTVGQAHLSDVAADADGAAVLRYSAPVVVSTAPVNRATITGPTVSVTYDDAASIAVYGVRDVSLQSVAEPAVDVDGVGSWLVAYLADAGQSVRSITVQPTTETEAATLLGLGLFDAVTLTRTPHNQGNQTVALCRVEGRSMVLGSGVGDWSAVLVLSVIGDDPEPWLWGSGKVGVLTDGELYP